MEKLYIADWFKCPPKLKQQKPKTSKKRGKRNGESHRKNH